MICRMISQMFARDAARVGEHLSFGVAGERPNNRRRISLFRKNSLGIIACNSCRDSVWATSVLRRGFRWLVLSTRGEIDRPNPKFLACLYDLCHNALLIDIKIRRARAHKLPASSFQLPLPHHSALVLLRA